jgi:hypothetical protein
VLDQHCESIGRDPKAIQRSAQNMLFLGDDPETLERAKAMGERAWAGGVSQLQEIVGRYKEIGVNELIVPDFTLGRSVEQKTAVFDRFITEVAAPFR